MKLILCPECKGWGDIVKEKESYFLRVDCPSCKAIGLIPETGLKEFLT